MSQDELTEVAAEGERHGVHRLHETALLDERLVPGLRGSEVEHRLHRFHPVCRVRVHNLGVGVVGHHAPRASSV
jgi:hypothetical protein